MTQQLETLDLWLEHLTELQQKHLELDSTQFENAEQFIDNNFHSFQMNCNASIKIENQDIVFSWQESDFSLIVGFPAGRNWHYHFTSYHHNNTDTPGTFHITFSGAAYQFTNGKEDKAQWHYLFHLHDKIIKHLKIKETYSGNFQPLYPVSRARDEYENTVSYAWITDKYDGPLSGYCYLNGKLCYFTMIEETDFEQKRLYAIYRLSLCEKIKASYSHYLWIHVTRQYSWCQKLHLKKYRLKYQLISWWNKKRYLPKWDTVTKYHEKQDKFKQTHQLLGYFESH
jgi:hypothetical protein